MRAITPAAIYGDVASAPVTWVDAMLKQMSQPSTRQEYEIHVKFAIESWPDAVRALSVQSDGFQITRDEHAFLTAFAGECSPGSGLTEKQALKMFASFQTHPCFASLVERSNAIISEFDVAPFFKFGTRSPKDSPYAQQYDGRTPTGEAVLLNIATSWRAFEDLAQAQVWSGHGPKPPFPFAKQHAFKPLDHLPWFWFRAFQAWKPWQEFRCFMRDRQFMGATQYYGIEKRTDGAYVNIKAYQDLVERGDAYEAAIKRFFGERFLPATEGWCQGCVFDVAVDLDAGNVTLIEINPAFPSTFPGFMDWRDPSSFDGTLKWADASYLPDSGVVHVRADKLARELAQRNAGTLQEQ